MSILNDIKLPLKVLGIEYVLTPDGARVFTVLIKKKKNELVILEKKELSSSDLESFLAEQKTSTRILVSGKGLLTTKGSPKNEFVSELRDSHLTMMREHTLPSVIQDFSSDDNFTGLLLGAPFIKAYAKKLNITEGNSYCYSLTSNEFRADWDLPSCNIQINSNDQIESEYLGAYLACLLYTSDAADD